MNSYKVWIVTKMDRNNKRTEKVFEDVIQAYNYLEEQVLRNVNLKSIELYLATRFNVSQKCVNVSQTARG